jgi:acyl carrier protein
MTIEDFIKQIEEEIEEFEPGVLQPATNYRDIEDWSSMHALIIIALVDTEHDVTLTGEDLRKCDTVQDLYDLVKSRL